MSLPYNPKLRERAKELRKAGNLCEVLLWKQLQKEKFKQYDFDRQKIIGNFIVDFYCANCNVVIEIDGRSHASKQDYDLARDNFLRSLGLDVIHIYDSEIYRNVESVMEKLGTHPVFAEPPRPSGTPPQEGNYRSGAESRNSPPAEGCPKGGVVTIKN